jgi:hypothetical protein
MRANEALLALAAALLAACAAQPPAAPAATPSAATARVPPQADPYFTALGQLAGELGTYHSLAQLCGEVFPALSNEVRRAYSAWTSRNVVALNYIEGTIDVVDGIWHQLPAHQRQGKPPKQQLWDDLRTLSPERRTFLQKDPAKFGGACRGMAPKLDSRQLDLDVYRAAEMAALRAGPRSSSAPPAGAAAAAAAPAARAAAPAPAATPAATLVAVADGPGSPPAAQAASGACHDPLLEPGRFTVTPLEVTDRKTSLVWFRCPAMWVGKTGSCDSSMVLPSETWPGADHVPLLAVKRPTPWRLASPEELDTIAARGCGYLTNPKVIELFFERLWTRSAASGDNVWIYETDRVRRQVPKRPGRPNEFFAQTIYVRNAK